MNTLRHVRLGDVASVVGGSTPSASEPSFWGGEIPWITPAEMGRRETPFVTATRRTLTAEGLANCSAKLLPARSVILSTRAPIGYVVINDVPMATNQGCKGLVPGPLLDCEYLYFVLAASSEQLNELGSGTTFKELSGAKLKDFVIPLPPLDEQKRIVVKLDEATGASNKLICNVTKQEVLIRALRTSVGSKALSGLSGAQVPLEEVASVDYGTRVTRKGDGGTKYPVYGGGGETFRTDSWNREDCFIVSRFAMSEECVRFVGGKFFLNDSGLSVSTRDAARLPQDFLDTYLLAKSADIYALGRGTAQHNLDVPAFKAMPVPIPPHDEQERFVARIEGLRREIKRLNALQVQKRAFLGELNKAILSSLLQGQP